MKFLVGERVELRKQHPCGGKIFQIKRVGMDFRIKCETCGKEVWIERQDFEKRYKRRVSDERKCKG